MLNAVEMEQPAVLGRARARGLANSQSTNLHHCVQPSCSMSCSTEISTSTEGPIVDVTYRLFQ